MMEFKNYKLNELGEITTGKTPKTDDKNNYNTNDVLFIKPEDISKSSLTYIHGSNNWVSFKGASECRIVPRGSILVTCIGIIGKVAIVDVAQCIFNQQINAIIPNQDIVDRKYLAYLLLSKQQYLQDKANAPIVPIINKSDFSKLELKIPPLEYQRKVVKLIEVAVTLIQKRQSQIEALDELTRSVFLEMFSNRSTIDRVKIGDILDVKSGSTPSRSNKEYWSNGTIPWIKTAEVNMNPIYSSAELITEKALVETSVSILPENTILVAMYGQGKTRGRVGILKIPATTNQACAAILPDPQVNPIFLFKQLQIQYDKLRELGRGGNQPNLNLALVKNFEIFLPDIAEQKEFNKKCVQIEIEKEKILASLNMLENLYQGVLLKTFEGNLFFEKS